MPGRLSARTSWSRKRRPSIPCASAALKAQRYGARPLGQPLQPPDGKSFGRYVYEFGSYSDGARTFHLQSYSFTGRSVGRNLSDFRHVPSLIVRENAPTRRPCRDNHEDRQAPSEHIRRDRFFNWPRVRLPNRKKRHSAFYYRFGRKTSVVWTLIIIYIRRRKEDVIFDPERWPCYFYEDAYFPPIR